MICLGIDTSGPVAHVAAATDEGVLARLATDTGKNHSETLLPAIRDVLATAGVSLRSVGLVAVGVGPGTWTGLRVGITTARSLAYTLGVPVIGIPTLDATAAGVSGYAGGLAVIVDARRSEVYGRCYDVDGSGGCAARGDIFVTPPERLGRFVGAEDALAGNGVGLLPENERAKRHLFPESVGVVDAGVICRLALDRYRRQGADGPGAVAPIYVRKSDAEVAREKKEDTVTNIC